MIIGICLSIMLILSFLSIILGSNWISNPMDTAIDNSVIVNGSTGSLEFPNLQSEFAIDEVQGAIIILIVIIVLVSVIGIHVVASGLSENSIRIITICTSYGGIWGILSVISVDLILDIQIFGSLIYIALTFIFIIGIIQKSISQEV